MTPGHTWMCPTCKIALATEHCPTCGERLLEADDLTLKGLLKHVLHALSSIDGKLLRTFRTLLASPGTLTVAYLQGPRKPYIAPFQFFLIVNVLFFAIQSSTGTMIFSTPLDSHLNLQDWRVLAQSLVDRRLQAEHTTLASYSPLFDQAVQVNAKSLVILMTLPFAVLLIPMFHGRHRPFVTHLVFALHTYAFLLVSLCVLLLIMMIDIQLGGAGARSKLLDRSLFGILLGAAAVHLFSATGRVYQSSGAGRVLKVTLLTIAIAAGVLGYRFLIFLITLYGT